MYKAIALTPYNLWACEQHNKPPAQIRAGGLSLPPSHRRGEGGGERCYWLAIVIRIV